MVNIIIITYEIVVNFIITPENHYMQPQMLYSFVHNNKLQKVLRGKFSFLDVIRM